MREQLESERLEHEMRAERSAYIEQPAVYVALASGDRRLYHWVEVGAEEEGVPCRLMSSAEDDVLALAYTAAQASRVGVGVAVGSGRAIVQETHMRGDHPVLSLPLADQAAKVCRLAGSNAGRLVKRMPLRFE